MKHPFLALAFVFLFTSHAPLLAQGDSCSTPDLIAGFGEFPFDTSAGITTSFGFGTQCAPTQTLIHEGYFVWTAPASGVVRFEADMPGDDEHLAVYRGTGCISACIADESRSVHFGSSIAYVDVPLVTAGDSYLIQIANYTQPGGPGTLRIGWQPCDSANYPDDSFEPNDSCATAAPLAQGIHLDLWTDYPEPDYYRVQIPPHRVGQIRITEAFHGVRATMFDNGCTPLGPFQGVWAERNHSSQPLDFILCVQSADIFSCATYDVSFEVLFPDCLPGPGDDDAYEDNDSYETPAAIVEGWHTNLIATVDDPDFYALDVPAGHRLQVQAITSAGPLPATLWRGGVHQPLTSWTNWSDATQRMVFEVSGTLAQMGDYCSMYSMDVSVELDGCAALGPGVFDPSPNDRLFLEGYYPDLMASPSTDYMMCVPPGGTVSALFDLFGAVGSLQASFFCDEAWGACTAGLGSDLALASGQNFQLRWTNPTQEDALIHLGVTFNGPANDCNRYSMSLSGVGGCTYGLDAEGFCFSPQPNSTGLPAQLSATQSNVRPGLHLDCVQGPPTHFGYLLAGTSTTTLTLMLGQGELCLALQSPNLLGRYNTAGSPLNSVGQFDSYGRFVNLEGAGNDPFGYELPTHTPWGAPILPGETLHFQLWHRDAGGVSNISNGVSVTF